VRWTLRWEDEAVGDLLEIAGAHRNQAVRIRQRVNAFANAGDGDVKKLQGREDEWRLRVGDWRVCFT
jgi:mRNA-degrading endonuclease RelE of RelBE toxin-antitoxin system